MKPVGKPIALKVPGSDSIAIVGDIYRKNGQITGERYVAIYLVDFYVGRNAAWKWQIRESFDGIWTQIGESTNEHPSYDAALEEVLSVIR